TPRPPPCPLFPYTTLFRSAIAERVNSDLANDLGNLLNRTLGMLQRYRDGVVPPAHDMAPVDVELRQAFTDLPAKMTRQFADLQRSEEHTSELQSRENLVCR